MSAMDAAPGGASHRQPARATSPCDHQPPASASSAFDDFLVRPAYPATHFKPLGPGFSPAGHCSVVVVDVHSPLAFIC